MDENKGARIYLFVCDALKENPNLLGWVLKGITDGMALSVEQARKDQEMNDGNIRRNSGVC